MEMLILERFCDHAEMGVFGEIYHDGEFVCYTVEQPWRENRPFLSCVPSGRYQMLPYGSARHGQTFALHNPDLDVHIEKPRDRGRWACLIHAARFARELTGGIAPGLKLAAGRHPDAEGPEWMVAESHQAVARLFERVGRLESWELNILWKGHPQ